MTKTKHIFFFFLWLSTLFLMLAIPDNNPDLHWLDGIAHFVGGAAATWWIITYIRSIEE